MSTWVVVVIIFIALAFIVSTITALLKSKPFHFSEEYEKTKNDKPKNAEKDTGYKNEYDNNDDDDRSGLM